VSADFYVDGDDSSTFWQVLHSGLQNKFAPSLDEWFEMDTFTKKAGKVKLPDKCKKVPVEDADDGNMAPATGLELPGSPHELRPEPRFPHNSGSSR
jgi:hypothetical protein